MKKSLGFILGLFLAGQYAVAGDDLKSDVMEEATEQQGSVEQFEQTLQDSPTAAGLADMDKSGEEMTDQVQEPIETGESSDVYPEPPMIEATQQ